MCAWRSSTTDIHYERPGSEWMHEPPEVESLVARCALACRDMEAGEGSNEIVEHPHDVLQIVWRLTISGRVNPPNRLKTLVNRLKSSENTPKNQTIWNRQTIHLKSFDDWCKKEKIVQHEIGIWDTNFNRLTINDFWAFPNRWSFWKVRQINWNQLNFRKIVNRLKSFDDWQIDQQIVKRLTPKSFEIVWRLTIRRQIDQHEIVWRNRWGGGTV